MIYPIVAYGDPVLRKETRDIEQGEIDVKKLAEDMYETMYAASGVGLAAPQIGLDIRMFIVDGTAINENIEDPEDYDPSLEGFKKVFINATIEEEEGDEWAYEEGCLSIPGIRADVYRPEKIQIHYYDTDWNEHEETHEGLAARIIQHEYDHVDGILFVDHLSGLKKATLRKKLAKITKGIVDAEYKMRFPK